jgi:pilus assembly protein CpaE
MATVLIIDDDHDILRLMQFAFQRANYQVTLASDGQEGLEAVERISPDLIIADVMMPEMTGYDFTRQVRAMPGMEKLPIIIYSARFQPVDKQAALDAGATDYMPKTVSPSEIVKRVSELIGEETAASTPTKSVTLAFFSLRGGVGVTSLAINAAIALALGRKTPIGLTDLNPVAGHAGLMLGLRPQSHLYNLLKSKEDLSGAVVKQHLTEHSSGVHLLASPLVSPDTSDKYEVKAVIESLGSLFKFNIIDLPHNLNEAIREVLPELDKLVLILSPDVPSLQSAAAAMRMLPKHGLKQENIMPVLNRNTSIPGLSTEAIEKTLRRTLFAEIPFEPNMIMAINSGKPLVLHSPQSAATTAIARLAVSLTK